MVVTRSSTLTLGGGLPIGYKGGIACAANPNYPAAVGGDMYIVTTAGKIGGASGPNVVAGDIIIAKSVTAAGDHATVGANWDIVETNVDWSSVTITGGTINGATIGATTASTIKGTDLTVDNIYINTNDISSTSGDLTLTPVAGSDVVIDSHWEFDGPLMTAITDNDTTITAYTGKAIKIEGVGIDGGVITGVTTAITGTANNALAISIPDQPSSGNTAGVGMTLEADDGGTLAAGACAGGDMTIKAGNAGGSTGNANGGNIVLTPGDKVNSGTDGSVTVSAGHNLKVDHVDEVTADHGVNADGWTLKDGGATIATGGTNTFNITNGTSSLDIAASSALDVNANLTVESASFVNQDLTTDASPSFTLVTAGNFDFSADGAIRDEHDNELLAFTHTNSAVNNVLISNSATGNAATISTGGDDSAVGLSISTKSGASADVNGANITITGGTAGSGGTGNHNGGDIVLAGGAKAGSGTQGVVDINGPWNAAGQTCSDLGTVTTADINGGSIDATTIGAGTAAAVTGTTITGSAFVTTGDITSTAAAIDWDLKDADGSALSFDAAGKAGILEIVTTDNAEGIQTSGFFKASDYSSIGMGAATTKGICLFAGSNGTTMPAATTAFRHLQTGGNVTELAGATITDICGAYFNTFTITDGGGAETVGHASTVYIANAPTVGTTPSVGTYALYVDAGKNRFDGVFNAAGTDLTANQVWGATAAGTAMEGKTVTSGAGISVTHAANSITIAATGSGMAWSEVTGTTQAMAVATGYIANNGALVTLTLPTSAAVGSVMQVVGKGAGLWKIAQNASQTIHFGNQNTTTGAGGYISAVAQYDTVEIVCITADTDFVVTSAVGNLTVA